MSTLGSISSPDRYLSIRLSSSLSWMMPSISSPRSSSIRSWSAADGAPSVRAAAGVAEQLLRQQPDQPVHRGPDRQVQRRHGVAEGVPAGGQGGVEVGPLVVDLGDDHGARHAHRGALLPQHPGHAVDPVGGGDGEQRRVGGPQPGPEVPREVGVAGRVEQVDLDAVVHEGRERQVDRTLLPDLDLIEVADRGALFDAALPLDGPRRGEQRLDQAGLPRTRMADQHHVPYLVGRRCPASGSSRPTRCCCQLPSPPCDSLVRTTSLNPRAP